MRDKSINGRKPDKNPRPIKARTESPSTARTLAGGHDPVEMGRRGGLARAAKLSAEDQSIIGANAQLARTLKHKKQLFGLVGPALDSLRHALKIAHKSNDPAALIKVVTAILDRTGFHGKSGVELEGELTHSGELIHRNTCLDVDKLPLIVKRMMAASIESGWEPSAELTEKIKLELPMLQVKVESDKPSKGKPINHNNGSNNAGSYQSSISVIAAAGATDHVYDQEEDDDDDTEPDQDDNGDQGNNNPYCWSNPPASDGNAH